jgi:hypothetical protein
LRTVLKNGFKPLLLVFGPNGASRGPQPSLPVFVTRPVPGASRVMARHLPVRPHGPHGRDESEGPRATEGRVAVVRTCPGVMVRRAREPVAQTAPPRRWRQGGGTWTPTLEQAPAAAAKRAAAVGCGGPVTVRVTGTVPACLHAR